MAIEIHDDTFRRWLAQQSDETRRDLELFWRHEVIRHPYIRANPANAGELRKGMILAYATEQHDYDPNRVVAEPTESEASTDQSWRSRWPKQQDA